MEYIKKNVIKQVFLLGLIVIFVIVIFKNLSYFIPGFFGAITLYLLLRYWYFKLIEERHWKRWLAATALILGMLVVVILPLYGLIEILIPRFTVIVDNSDQIKESVIGTLTYLQSKFPQIEISNEQISGAIQKVVAFVPVILSSMAGVFANIFTALFILYFMLMGGRKMESTVIEYMPLTRKNKVVVWKETKNMIISNALGIPFLGLCQGIVAWLGYWICGVPSSLLWGLLTGICTIVPFVGTMVIWIPVAIYLLSINQVGYAIGLSAYCLVIVGGIDNVIRFMFLKQYGDVHPLITVFGVILGLGMFGVMGLIFGPLMISYLLLLIKIYRAEFNDEAEEELFEETMAKEAAQQKRE